jgi:hypothetical protein
MFQILPLHLEFDGGAVMRTMRYKCWRCFVFAECGMVAVLSFVFYFCLNCSCLSSIGWKWSWFDCITLRYCSEINKPSSVEKNRSLGSIYPVQYPNPFKWCYLLAYCSYLETLTIQMSKSGFPYQKKIQKHMLKTWYHNDIYLSYLRYVSK